MLFSRCGVHVIFSSDARVACHTADLKPTAVVRTGQIDQSAQAGVISGTLLNNLFNVINVSPQDALRYSRVVVILRHALTTTVLQSQK